MPTAGRFALSLSARRAAFIVYALLLVTATHWPNFGLPVPGRPDLVVHMAAFGLWTALAVAAALFGPALTPRNVLLTAALATVVACIDEATQSLPLINRVAAIDDAAANLLGVALASGVALLLALRRSSRPSTGPAQSGAAAG